MKIAVRTGQESVCCSKKRAAVGTDQQWGAEAWKERGTSCCGNRREKASSSRQCADAEGRRSIECSSSGTCVAAAIS